MTDKEGENCSHSRSVLPRKPMFSQKATMKTPTSIAVLFSSLHHAGASSGKYRGLTLNYPTVQFVELRSALLQHFSDKFPTRQQAMLRYFPLIHPFLDWFLSCPFVVKVICSVTFFTASFHNTLVRSQFSHKTCNCNCNVILITCPGG